MCLKGVDSVDAVGCFIRIETNGNRFDMGEANHEGEYHDTEK